MTYINNIVYFYFLDWMKCIQIVDPSIQNTNPSGMKINCFCKRYPEWLPNANYGDVVILRHVKVNIHQ